MDPLRPAAAEPRRRAMKKLAFPLFMAASGTCWFIWRGHWFRAGLCGALLASFLLALLVEAWSRPRR